MHQVHAAGAVGRVVADEDGAGVHGAALGNAHKEERRRQQDFRPGKAHDPVADGVPDGQQQDAWFQPQHTRQHTGQKTRQQIADAHQREQRPGHAVGKPILFLQQADHHAAGNGADAAEKESHKARIPQARFLLVHSGLLTLAIERLLAASQLPL